MAKQETFKESPALTDNLRTDLMHVAMVLQNRPEIITKALTDPATRKEMVGLVNDLFSLVEVIENGD